MATYASSSNPFIKPRTNRSPDGDQLAPGPKRKDAPGMAIASSCKPKDHDKILHLSDEPKSNGKITESLEEIELEAASNEMINFSDSPKKEILSEEIEFDEITKACESLVETTIRLELEEESGPIDSKNSIAVAADGVDENDNKVCIKEPHNHNHQAEEDRPEQEQEDENELSSGHRQHLELIKKLRLQLRDLERYAYERGELGQVPVSVVSERQTVILDTLKERLSLSIDMNEIEKLELDELKKQVDKEIHDLIDPLITKDHLLGQLKTQLTDLERYISYLHGTIGKIHDKSTCTCHVHGCCTDKLAELSADTATTNNNNNESRTINGSGCGDTGLPRTTKLIRSLVTQLICSDIKLRESAKKAQILEEEKSSSKTTNSDCCPNKQQNSSASSVVLSKAPNSSRPCAGKAADDAAWTLHIDKVILATDSLVNLFTTEPEYQRAANTIDDRLVESIVRRQLVPAIRDLLSYGLIDPSSAPKSTSYVSLLFDPYYLLTSLTCFPSSARAASPIGGSGIDTSGSGKCTTAMDKLHLWNVIEEYYQSRNDPKFKSSSIKTLSQSFDLAPSISGPIKITSKQALLISIEDINETLSKSKPNGPESHFRAFIYTALNRAKLSTWLRIVFKNKSVCRRFYHNFSFVGHPEMMDKLLATLEPLSQFSFKLRTDVESIEQFVSAF